LTQGISSERQRKSIWVSDTALLIYVALATVIAHWATGNRYGFQRDELATLDDARHLDWGYVAYPPITPLFGRFSLNLFGTSLAGFRFFAAVAQAVAVVLTGAATWRTARGTTTCSVCRASVLYRRRRVDAVRIV